MSRLDLGGTRSSVPMSFAERCTSQRLVLMAAAVAVGLPRKGTVVVARAGVAAQAAGPEWQPPQLATLLERRAVCWWWPVCRPRQINAARHCADNCALSPLYCHTVRATCVWVRRY